MKRIQIGNDFRVSWTLTQLGEAFNLVGKTYDIEVASPYGVILVNDVVAEDNVLSFNIPASQQVYLGNYDITLTITNDEQTWRLKQCDAFALVPCDCGDVVEIVQLSSSIVYPSNGLNAYQLAVLNGEYTGDYAGYQRWLARYAENTANEAVNIANEAKENSSTALSTAQKASEAANDAKKAVANKQDTLTLTVKDNGNIVIGNIQGQTKEFMPATPSGDPNHYMYEKCGAVWNGDTGYWELNGLTDLTNEDMQECYSVGNVYMNPITSAYQYASKKFRTNMWVDQYFDGNYDAPFSSVFRNNSKLEVINLKGNITEYIVYSLTSNGNIDYCFRNCDSFRRMIGIVKINGKSLTNTFFHCYKLEEIYINGVNTNASFADSSNLSKESLLYLINKAGTAEFTITLHADTYAWASVDEDIQAALAEKTNITLQSA